jgi:hypothetical protein
MLTCPIKTSRDWQAIMAETNGDETEARRLWIEREFDQDPDLNKPVADENFDDARTGEPGTAEPETNDFSGLVQRIKIYISKQIEILNQRKIKNQKYKQSKLRELLEAMENMNGVESINLFIQDAYNKSNQVQKRFSDLLKNKNQMDNKDVLNELTAINDFANSYSILDEIDSADIMNYFTLPEGVEDMPGPMTPQKMLRESIKIRDKVERR